MCVMLQKTVEFFMVHLAYKEHSRVRCLPLLQHDQLHPFLRVTNLQMQCLKDNNRQASFLKMFPNKYLH